MSDRYSAIGNPVAHSKSPLIVIDATSAGLTDSLPAGIFVPGALAYVMYRKAGTPFLARARAEGAGVLADGLSMLIEQAAESFFVVRRKTEHPGRARGAAQGELIWLAR